MNPTMSVYAALAALARRARPPDPEAVRYGDCPWCGSAACWRQCGPVEQAEYADSRAPTVVETPEEGR